MDDFVNQCRKRVTIECLRDDLDAYYRTLKSSMVELINKDYADFVNLSSNLVRSVCRRMRFRINAHLVLPLNSHKFCIRTVHATWYVLQVGVDKSIDGLATPLTQLKEEVLVCVLLGPFIVMRLHM